MVSPLYPQQFQQGPNFGEQLLGAVSQGQNIAANRQAMQMRQQAADQQVSENDYNTSIRKLTVLRNLAANARKLPMEQRQQFLQNSAVALESLGYTPEQIASQPLDDQSLDQYVAQISSALPMNDSTVRVQSSQVLDDGTTVQVMSDGSTRVTDPSGAELRGAERSSAIKQANQYGVDLQTQRAGGRVRAGLEERMELEPELQADIARAKAEVKAAVEKQVSQQGQLGKLSDAQSIYDRMRDSDLEIIYGRGEKWYPEFLRSQRGIDLMADRDQLIGMLQLGARGELKGQGPITDSEQKILSNAVTVLGNANVSPQRAKDALDEAMNILRRNAGIGQGASVKGAMTPGINPAAQQEVNWGDL